MRLRALCMCFSPSTSDTRDGVGFAHRSQSLTQQPNVSVQEINSRAGRRSTNNNSTEDSTSSSVLCAGGACRKLRGPSSVYGNKPTDASAPPTESCSEEPTTELQNKLPPITLELAKVADGREIPGITFPAAATMPASFGNTEPATRRLKSQYCNRGSVEAGIAATALPKVVQPVISGMASLAGNAQFDVRGADGPTAAAKGLPVQQSPCSVEPAAAVEAPDVAPEPVPEPGPVAAAATSIFTTGAALGGGGGGGAASVVAAAAIATGQGRDAHAGAVVEAGPAPLVPQYNSAPIAPVYNSRTKLPYLASRHMSQVAFLHMLHVGGSGSGVAGPGGPASGSSSSIETSPPLPPPLPLPLPASLQHHHNMWTLNMAALSREITGLRWIGQGGGGAVFQGIWQGAPVAVKFLLTDPETFAQDCAAGGGGAGSMYGGMDVLALEGVVSSVVNHPNVVHTFAFQCARLTEASFTAGEAEDERLDSLMDEQGNRELFESLLDTAGLYGGTLSTTYGNNSQYGSGARRRVNLGATSGLGGTGGCSGTASTSVAAPSRLVPGASAGAGGGGFQLARFASIVEEDGGGNAAAAAAINTAASDSECDIVQVEKRRKDVAPQPPPPPQKQREPLQQPGGAEVGAEGERDSGGGGGSSGGGTGRRRALAPGGLRTRAVAQSAAHAHLLQQQKQQLLQQRQATLDSTFHSGEGFGDPESGSSRGWTVRQALQHLKARPGMSLTYIIMEYCDRGSLLAAIRRGIFKTEDHPDQTMHVVSAAAAADGGIGRFPRRIVLRAILRTARDVAQGMCHLHANGIIHGDLKPGNVLLRGCRTDRRGFVAMVADFGLSKVTHGDKPLEAHHWSTVTVMAPEAIMGRWLKASDVFSYGILLWQLVTSEAVPYGKLSIPQILMGVSQGTLKPEWPPSAHPALVRLGRACLATSPEKRPSFEAIVKVLIKIEKHVRDELKVQRAREAAAAAAATTAVATASTAAAAAASAAAAVTLVPRFVRRGSATAAADGGAEQAPEL